MAGQVLNNDFLVEVFNNTVRDLRGKAEVWCHTCWGNPGAQRIFNPQPSYAPAVEPLNRLDVDVITFECCSMGGSDLEAIGRGIKDKKIAIGVVDHHTLQVETPIRSRRSSGARSSTSRRSGWCSRPTAAWGARA